MPVVNKSPSSPQDVPENDIMESSGVEQTQTNRQAQNSLLLLSQSLVYEQTMGCEENEEISNNNDVEAEKQEVDHKAQKEGNTHSRRKRASKGRVFQCTGYPDCNMSFTRSEHLARHKRKHTGERPFTCPHCHKNFSRLDNLRQHKQTVHVYENFVGENAASMPMGAGYNAGAPGSHSGETSTNNVPIQNQLSKNKGETLNPESPLTTSFGVSPSSTTMISPPNTISPINHHYPYQNQSYYNGAYEMPNNSGNNFQYPQSQIKTQNNEFKPKRRPRPLSLVHSFTNDTNGNESSSYRSMQLLRSVPAMYTTSNNFTYPPKSVSLTPNMVSPLSPLFHQAFNQTMDLPPKSPHVSTNSLRLPAYNPSSMNNSLNISNNDKTSTIHNGQLNPNVTLPPVQELPVPTQFNPIKTSKNWLKEVLNDEASTSSNTKNDNSNQQVKEENDNDYKKPTINNLLSPYDDDKFPDSVK